MTLIDCLGINAMKIDKKLLSLVGDTEVVPFSEVYEETDPLSEKIIVGQNIGLVDTYQSVRNAGMNFLIQEGQDHFIYNLLMASIINKFPDAFLKNPLPAILRTTIEDDSNKIVVPFSSSFQKDEVMQKTIDFLDAHPRLSSIKHNVLLITNELMMNALYCAPVDDGGRYLYLNQDRSQPIQYPEGMQAEIAMSFNQSVLVIGCRDPFGSVDKDKVTSRLNEVFQQDRKASVKGQGKRSGGSGLGLKMIIETSTGFGMVVKKKKETFAYASLPLGKGNRTIEKMAKNLCMNFYH